MTGSVTIAAEIRDAVAPEVYARLEDGLAGEFTCVACGMDGDTKDGDDVSVILVRRPNADVYKLAHLTCSESRIITEDAPLTDLSGGESDVLSLTLTLPDKFGKQVPTLIIEQTKGRSLVSPTGDVVNPWLGSLLENGWELLRDRAQQPRKAWGYSLRTDRTTASGELRRSDEVVLDQLPQGGSIGLWLNAAVAAGTVTIYAGTGLGLGDLEGAEDLFGAVRDKLTDAIAEGRVAAARVTVVNNDSAPVSRTSEQETARQLAEELGAALKERARPGTGAPGRMNSLPELSPLPGRPVLSTVLAGGAPVLVVDLHTADDADGKTAALMAALRGAGLVTRTDWNAGRFAPPPKGWAFLLWKSQIAVIVDADTKFMFEPYAPVSDWYRAVQQQGAMGLLVGDLDLPAQTAANGKQYRAALDRAMAGGKAVASQLTGMCVD